MTPVIRHGACLPPLFAAFLLCGTVSLAQIREPVQHVYPSSTLAEIQQAIDNGGTVYFHPGEYTQVMRPSPGLPPSAANPAKGFNVGKYGKDVDIIGIQGPHGQRPRIHGGTITFRVGNFPAVGFVGLPVSVKIEDLEVNNPEIAGPGALYARVAIFVNDILGKNVIIRNCKFMVAGHPTDTGHASNHSGAIWVALRDAAKAASGAHVLITGNEIAVSRTMTGIVVGHFLPPGPAYTPPQLVVSGNVFEVAQLRGQSGTATAIFLAGGLPNAVVVNNVIRGDARSPGIATTSSAIHFARLAELATSSITVMHNDASGFMGDYQLYLGRTVTAGKIASNAFGPAAKAGIVSYASGNDFENNHFYGSYPGWESPSGGLGAILFASTAVSVPRNNRVVATKLNGPPFGFDVCTQVFDPTDIAATAPYDGANKIPGIEKCQKKTPDFFQRMEYLKLIIDARADEHIPPLLWP